MKLVFQGHNPIQMSANVNMNSNPSPQIQFMKTQSQIKTPATAKSNNRWALFGAVTGTSCSSCARG
jgi:hypothetical protein